MSLRSSIRLSSNYPVLSSRLSKAVPRFAMRTVVAVLAFAPLVTASAQEMLFDFAATVGGTGSDIADGMAVDSAGYVYITGAFSGTADFDPGAGNFPLTSAGGLDAYVCKLDPAGELLWAAAFGGTANAYGYDVNVDDAGNVYVTGEFAGTTDFDPSGANFPLISAGDIDAFVCKLDPSGGFLWAANVGGVGEDRAYGIDADGAGGSVFVTGFFTGVADFNPAGAVNPLTSAGDVDVFVLELDASGNYVWAGAIGGTARDDAAALTMDLAGNVYITGSFSGTADFNPGVGSFSLTSGGGSDAFVCKLDGAGNFLWAGALSGAGAGGGYDIAMSEGLGLVGIAADIVGTVDCNPGVGTAPLTSAGSNDALICLLDSAGNFVYAGAIGGTATDYAQGIAFDSTGMIYVTGYFNGTVDLDPGALVFPATSTAGPEGFICKLDASGVLDWAGSMGGNDSFYCDRIAADGGDNLYVSGSFRATADADPGAGTATVTSAGNNDAFVLKFNPRLAPVANGDAGETNADQLLTALTTPASNSVLSNDTDADSLTVTSYDATSAQGATVLVNTDGTFIYDPTAVAAFQALAPGDSLVDTFTYTVSDGLDTAVGTVTITVRGAGSALPSARAWGLAALALALLCVGVGKRPGTTRAYA